MAKFEKGNPWTMKKGDDPKRYRGGRSKPARSTEREIADAIALARRQLIGIIKDPDADSAVKIRAIRDLRALDSAAASPREQRYVIIAPAVCGAIEWEAEANAWQDQEDRRMAAAAVAPDPDQVAEPE